MKHIYNFKSNLDLEVEFMIDGIEISGLSIVKKSVPLINIYLKITDKDSYEQFLKLDRNIKERLNSFDVRYKYKYVLSFDESIEKIDRIKYLYKALIIRYNSKILGKIKIIHQNGTVYLKTMTETEKELIIMNKIDVRFSVLLEKTLGEKFKIVLTSENIVTKEEKEIEKKQEIKKQVPTIVDSEVGQNITITGTIFNIVEKELTRKDGNKFYLVTFYITDSNRSIIAKKFYNDNNHELKINDTIECKGIFTKDMQYDRDYYINIKQIKKVGEESYEIVDDSEEKRVELGLLTNMSEMSSNIDCKKVSQKLEKMGYKAFAVTDLGVVHSYPFIYNEKSEMKNILGLSAYVVDDQSELIVNPRDNKLLDETYVVFDIETTGFNPYVDKIIEIGAVKLKNFEVVDKFSAFVNPHMDIPEEIVKLTGITNEDVKDERAIEQVLPEFIDFIKNTTLVAHNAKFDVGFITAKSKEQSLDTNFSYIDTISWAKLVLPEQKRFNLDALCKTFNIENKNHHRAVNDADVTSKLFVELFKRVLTHNVVTLKDVNEKLKIDVKIAPVNLVNILLKNQKGLAWLYEIVSDSHIKYFGNKIPRVPKSLLNKNREDFLIAPSPNLSFGKSGELVSMYRRGIDKEEIEKAAEFYDFFEIYPEDKYQKDVEKKEITGYEDIRKMNKYIIDLGKKQNKKVVAIGDVCYFNKSESKGKQILQMSNGEFSDMNYNSNSHFRTTKEMLESFSYLDEKTRHEVVIKNTNDIADMIEKVRPIPKGFYPPVIKGAKEEVRKLTYDGLKEKYGDKIPKIIQDRLDKELNTIIGNGFAVLYLSAQKLVKKSVDNGYLVGSRGSVGSSLVAYLMGITEVNGLEPHYRCAKCKYIEIFEKEISGVDLPDKNCPNCDIKLIKDGHAIPFEVFMGFNGDKVPDIDLNFSGEFQSEIHKYTEELFGAKNTFRAGTIQSIKMKNSVGLARAYFEKNAKEKAKEAASSIYNEDSLSEAVKDFEKKYIEEDKLKNKAEIERLALMIVGAKKTTGQHPGGMIIVPEGKSIYEFTPIQKPANDVTSESTTTHFDYHVMEEQLVKLDILGHDDPTTLKMLEDLTGISPYDVPLTDKRVLSLFSSTKELGVTPEQIETELGTNGIPEFGTQFVKEMLKDTRPKTFTELVRISGLSHGTDVWLNNAKEYVNAGIATLSEIITVRDDIMNYLILQGMDKGLSFKIMEFVRKGRTHKDKKTWEEYKKQMTEAKVPTWYIESCEKIKYMFPKGHAVAYVMMAIRIAYFKVYRPLEFYTAYLNRKLSSFTLSKKFLPINKLKAAYFELLEKPNKNAKDKDEVALFEILIEMHYRKIELVNVDIYKSAADKFVIQDGKIRIPLVAVDGLGEIVAKKIESSREHKFSSKEDLAKRTDVNKTVMEFLDNNNIISFLNETDQQTLF